MFVLTFISNVRSLGEFKRVGILFREHFFIIIISEYSVDGREICCVVIGSFVVLF